MIARCTSSIQSSLPLDIPYKPEISQKKFATSPSKIKEANYFIPSLPPPNPRANLELNVRISQSNLLNDLMGVLDEETKKPKAEREEQEAKQRKDLEIAADNAASSESWGTLKTVATSIAAVSAIALGCAAGGAIGAVMAVTGALTLVHTLMDKAGGYTKLAGTLVDDESKISEKAAQIRFGAELTLLAASIISFGVGLFGPTHLANAPDTMRTVGTALYGGSQVTAGIATAGKSRCDKEKALADTNAKGSEALINKADQELKIMADEFHSLVERYSQNVRMTYQGPINVTRDILEIIERSLGG